MELKQGDIVIVPFSTADMLEGKVRPAVIIHTQSDFNDVTLLKITTSIRNDDFSFALTNNRVTIPLRYESEIRTNHFQTIEKSIIRNKVSELKPQALIELLEEVRTYFELEEE